MKTRFFLNQLLSVIAILCCVNLSTTIAQKNKMVDKQQGITYCDEYISETKSVLEKKANTTCRTAKETIPCNDKKTGLPVHVTMVIQPTEKGCPNYVKVATSIAEEPMSRGTSKNRFSVEVIQEPRAVGGGWPPGPRASGRRLTDSLMPFECIRFYPLFCFDCLDLRFP